MPEHNWSGWPGAWCLDCGCDDPREIALADGSWDEDADGNPIVRVTAEQMECKEPGSGRFDPYRGKMIDRADFEACRILINDIQALESRAHRLKAHETGQALNRAKNTIGWELARATERLIDEQTG